MRGARRGRPRRRRRDGSGAAPPPRLPCARRSPRRWPDRSAHYYLGAEIELTRALGWLLKAVARAAREVPEVNGLYVDGAFRPADAVHLGVAVSLRRGGLVAAALHDVDRKPLGDLMRELNDLVARTRGGGLRSSELTDATLTVTSLGDLGVRTVYGVIYPPQVALVGFGRVQERPWAPRAARGRGPRARLPADPLARRLHRLRPRAGRAGAGRAMTGRRALDGRRADRGRAGRQGSGRG